MSVPFENKVRILPVRNPYSVAKIENAIAKLGNSNLYETLQERVNPAKTPPVKKLVTDAINTLKQRMNGTTMFTNENFGRIEMLDLTDIIINIDNQRDIDWDHISHIVETFDPRAAQVVNVIKLADGRYSVPEGQHTATVLFLLYQAGLLPKNFKIQCKVVDALQTVPGSDTKGEAFGNFLFRLINYKGRKAVEPYFMHKSRVSGVRNYDSKLLEDIHAERIQTMVEENNMFTCPAIEARGTSAKPGMVTYITGLNKIAEHETENFDIAINDLEFALSLHNRYFANEKGVEGGFILALGRYAKLAHKSKVTITRDWQDELMKFFKATYASPSKFHKTCKTRLTKFNKSNDLPGGWSDNCLLSILILDFYKWCDTNDLNYPPLPDQHINKYNGI
jgi:hypothetical protein|tara:strand:+ start:16 stop:1194 length:1179 start_codon:yes stop_codon:yes gene_type:complete